MSEQDPSQAPTGAFFSCPPNQATTPALKSTFPTGHELRKEKTVFQDPKLNQAS